MSLNILKWDVIIRTFLACAKNEFPLEIYIFIIFYLLDIRAFAAAWIKLKFLKSIG